MKHQNTRRGFTLIELLVVVLIIGILAAVAVPQYKKAVENARFQQIRTNLDILMKSTDLQVLTNGFPSEEYLAVNTEISPSCAFWDNSFCYTHLGRYEAYCYPSGCTAWFDGSKYAGKDETVKNIGPLYQKGYKRLVFYRTKTQWTFNGDTSDRAILCPLIYKNYKEIFVQSGLNACQNYI